MLKKYDIIQYMLVNMNVNYDLIIIMSTLHAGHSFFNNIFNCLKWQLLLPMPNQKQSEILWVNRVFAVNLDLSKKNLFFMTMDNQYIYRMVKMNQIYILSQNNIIQVSY